jgi:MraZ protein
VVDFPQITSYETKDDEREVKVLSKGLKGEYNHTIDAKGRLIVPSKLREQLGMSFVITRGTDGCLFAYPNDEWEVFEGKLRELPLTNDKARTFKRFFQAGAADCEVDNQGRVLLPGNLREFASISKEVVIAGVGDHAEIWSKDKWDEKNNIEDIDIDELALSIEELGFNI